VIELAIGAVMALVVVGGVVAVLRARRLNVVLDDAAGLLDDGLEVREVQGY